MRNSLLAVLAVAVLSVAFLTVAEFDLAQFGLQCGLAIAVAVVQGNPEPLLVDSLTAARMLSISPRKLWGISSPRSVADSPDRPFDPLLGRGPEGVDRSE